MSKNPDRDLPRKSEKATKKRKSSEYEESSEKEEPKRLRRTKRGQISTNTKNNDVSSTNTKDENDDPTLSTRQKRSIRRSRLSDDPGIVLSPKRRVLNESETPPVAAYLTIPAKPEAAYLTIPAKPEATYLTIPAKQNKSSPVQRGGLKMCLRRRFRTQETDSRLGSDGASLRGSTTGDEEETNAIEVTTNDDSSDTTAVKGEKRKWTNSECEEPTFEDDGSNIQTQDRYEGVEIKTTITSSVTFQKSTNTCEKSTSTDDITEQEGGNEASTSNAEESTSAKQKNKRKKVVIPSPRKILKVVDCGVRNDGTVCKCYSDMARGLRGEDEVSASASASNRSAVETSSSRALSILRAALQATRSNRQSSNLDMAYLWPDTDDTDYVTDDDGSEAGENSDPESMYDTTIEDIDSDLAMNSPPDSRLHRCLSSCPIGCRGVLRPSEIIIFESKCTKRLLKPGMKVSMENPINIDFRPSNFKRVGGRGIRRALRTSYQNASSSNQNSGVSQPPSMPQRVAFLLDRPPVSKQEAMKHTWNPHDRSFNVRISEQDLLTIRRQPVAQSTDAARSLMGYSSGLHIFEVTWPVKQRGTHSMVGVATDRQILHSVGYSSLIGLTDQSWGWDLIRHKSFHNSSELEGRDYPASKPKDFNVKKSFHLILDCDAGTLGFAQGGVWLGIAHSNLKNKTVYPTVSSVWGHCEVTLRYHGGLDSGSVPRLMDLCRVAIKVSVASASSTKGHGVGVNSMDSNKLAVKINTLPISPLMKNFINNAK